MEFNGYTHGPYATDPEPGRCTHITRRTPAGYDTWVTYCGRPTEDQGESPYCDWHADRHNP